MPDYLTHFESLRPRLYGIAYRMLGSRADSEDVLQEAWLRLRRKDSMQFRSAEAWLVTTVTRLCIDRLRALRVQRRHYVGCGLPEPLIGDVAENVERAADASADLSMAFLVMLEKLAPEERAAFLLHEVLDCDYSELSQILGKNQVTCRQIVSRARKRVRAGSTAAPAAVEQQRELLERLVHALQTENKPELLQLVAKDACWTSDGGGKVPAALKVVRGGERVVRFATAVLSRHIRQSELKITSVNREPALALESAGKLISVITLHAHQGQIREFFSVRNPQKLASGVPSQSMCGRCC